MQTETLTKFANGRGPVPLVKQIFVKGIAIQTYSIGWLSYWSHLSIQTFRLWERLGILPRPVFEIPGGIRWYSSREILEFSKVISEHYQAGRDRQTLKACLHGVNKRLIRQYSLLSNANRNEYDSDYFALPAQATHEQAMNEAVAAAKQTRRTCFTNTTFRVKPQLKRKGSNEITTSSKGKVDGIGIVYTPPRKKSSPH